MANNDILIEEPSDLDESSLTNDDAILVYSKDPNQAGIKRLNLVSWKRYLQFNAQKVDNLKKCIGLNVDLDQDPFVAPTPTVIALLDAIFDQTGVERNPSSPTPQGNDIVSKLSKAIGDIQNLQLEIGTSPSGSPDAITRIENLETTVGDSNNGLVKDVTDLKTTTSTLTQDVTTLQTKVGDSNNGLVKDVTDLKTTTSTLTQDVTTLQTKVDNFSVRSYSPKGSNDDSLLENTTSGQTYKVIAKKEDSGTTSWFEGVFENTDGNSGQIYTINDSQITIADYFDTDFLPSSDVTFVSLQRISQ